MKICSKAFHFLKDFVAHPALDPETRQDLVELASAPTDHHWIPGTPLAEVNHCHYTNTPEELKHALEGGYNFVEGDVRLEGGIRRCGLEKWREPIMAHDVQDVDGLSFGEWLDVVDRSGRGVKIDIKQAAALPEILEEVRERHIGDDMLIFNMDVVTGPGAPRRLKWGAHQIQDMTMDMDDLRWIRREHPQAMLSLGAYTGGQPAGTTYSDKTLDHLGRMADELGGPVSFPLRAEFVTPETVARLKPHGIISVWNDPKTYAPDDVAAETKRLREMGVEGIIDLRGKA